MRTLPLDVHLGQRYPGTRLTLIERSGRTDDGRPYVRCLCECGDHARILWESIRRGLTKSCGCLRDEKLSARNIAKSSLTSLLGMWIPGSQLRPIRVVSGGKNPIVEFECLCARLHLARWNAVRRLHTKSCGCLRRDAAQRMLAKRAEKARAAA